MDIIFHYDLVSISLPNKIIRYIFLTKYQMFLFFFNYLVVVLILKFKNSNLANFQSVKIQIFFLQRTNHIEYLNPIIF